MTIARLIWHMLRWKPGSDGMTATQLLYRLSEVGYEVKLSSLSGQLCKMVKAGELGVLPGFGPRGGNGYVLKD